MVCSICKKATHNAKQCSQIICEQILHEIIDGTFNLQMVIRNSLTAANGDFMNAILMGAHDRLGSNSPILHLTGSTDLIVKIMKMSYHVGDEIVISNDMELCEMEYFIGQNRDTPSPHMFKEHCYMLQDNRTIHCYPSQYNITEIPKQYEHVIPIKRSDDIVWINSSNVDIIWYNIVGDDILYVFNSERVLKCYRLYRNNPEWLFFVQHNSSYNRITAISNSIYIGCRSKNMVMCVRDGKFAWKQNVNDVIITELTVVNGNLFFATMRTLYVLTCKSGKVLYSLQYHLLDEQFYVESLTFSIITDSDGRLSCVDIKGGNTVWSNNNLEISSVKPTVFKEQVITVSNERHLVSLNKHTGDFMWVNKIGTKILNTPCVTDHFIYIGCLNKKIYKVNPHNGKIMWDYKVAGAIEDKIMYNTTNIIVLSRGTTCMYLFKK